MRLKALKSLIAVQRFQPVLCLWNLSSAQEL
jgi:hypothetical protein